MDSIKCNKQKVILAGAAGNIATLTYIDALTLSIDAIVEGETITGDFTAITLSK